jgi:hypothetical protein
VGDGDGDGVWAGTGASDGVVVGTGAVAGAATSVPVAAGVRWCLRPRAIVAGVNEHFMAAPGAAVNVKRSPLLRARMETICGVIMVDGVVVLGFVVMLGCDVALISPS